MRQNTGFHKAGEDKNKKHLTNKPTQHETTVPVNMGGRTKGPRVGYNLRDELPGPVTVPV